MTIRYRVEPLRKDSARVVEGFSHALVDCDSGWAGIRSIALFFDGETAERVARELNAWHMVRTGLQDLADRCKEVSP